MRGVEWSENTLSIPCFITYSRAALVYKVSYGIYYYLGKIKTALGWSNQFCAPKVASGLKVDHRRCYMHKFGGWKETGIISLFSLNSYGDMWRNKHYRSSLIVWRKFAKHPREIIFFYSQSSLLSVIHKARRFVIPSCRNRMMMISAQKNELYNSLLLRDNHQLVG